MNNVLIVEHNSDLISSIEKAIAESASDLKLFICENGEEAINILKKTAISVLVTDLYMPKVDGLELLAFMSRRHPKTPVIMATVSTPAVMKYLDTLGIFRFLKKPYKPEDLVAIINEAITQATGGKQTGRLSTGSFLQLLQEEQRSCTLTTVNHQGAKGRFYLIDGRLYDARCGDLKGDDAAINILGWERVALDLKDIQTEDIKARIHLSLNALIAKAAGLAEKEKPVEHTAPEEAAQTNNPEQIKEEAIQKPAPKKPTPPPPPVTKKALNKEDLSKMLVQAVLSAESCNMQLAQHILGKILKIYPKSSKSWLWFARTTDDFNTLNVSLKNALTISPKDPEIIGEIEKVKSAVNSGCSEASNLKHCPFCWAPVLIEQTVCHYCNAHVDIHEDFFQSIFFSSNKDPDLDIINNSLLRLTKAVQSTYNNVHTHFSLAMAHVNLNHWEEALAELKQTSIIAPENNPYRQQLEIMADFIDDLGSFYQE